MKKSQLAARLAKETGVSKAQAADQLDKVVNQIVSNLKKGASGQLPGLGKFTPGPKWDFEFDDTGGKAGARRGKR
jgi:nucleoid DNA-binding protein